VKEVDNHLKEMDKDEFREYIQEVNAKKLKSKRKLEFFNEIKQKIMSLSVPKTL